MLIFINFLTVKNEIKNKRILITGGSSGLGRSLVEEFMKSGSVVVAIGRNNLNTWQKYHYYDSYVSDFAVLENINKLVLNLEREQKSFDLLINNAGVLSSPNRETTTDGFEYSYQVNFLSHVLLTRLLLKKGLLKNAIIVNVSSPIYRLGKLSDDINNKQKYRMFQVYANTKLYMALFTQRLAEEGLSSFSFNPGTFNSGIYRLQQKWFHSLYKFAGPFLTPSAKVAIALHEIILNDSWINGEMIDKSERLHYLNKYDNQTKQEFWVNVNEQIQKFIV